MLNRYALSLIVITIMVGIGYYLGYGGSQVNIFEPLKKVPNTQPQTPQYLITGMRIGVVNQIKIREEAEIFKKLMDEQNRLFQEAHQQFSLREMDIRKNFDALKQRPENERTMPDFLEQKEKFDKTVAHFQKEMLQKKEDLQKHFDEIRLSINRIVVSVIEEFSKEKGYDLIIDSTMAIYNKGQDLTDEIIKRLNMRTQEVKWKSPATPTIKGPNS